MLIGKNLSAVMFIVVEISAVTIVCASLGMPLNLVRFAEAYSVAGVLTIFLLGAGNLLSIHQARAVNPASSFRSGAAEAALRQYSSSFIQSHRSQPGWLILPAGRMTAK